MEAERESEAGVCSSSSSSSSSAFPSLPPRPREQERKLQQEKLSGVVKSVHRRLRKKYREETCYCQRRAARKRPKDE